MTVRELLAKQDETALFVSQHGTAITPRAIQQRLKTWSVKQGLPGNVHPHMLRHSFASHVLQSSGDLRACRNAGPLQISTRRFIRILTFNIWQRYMTPHMPRAKRKPSKT